MHRPSHTLTHNTHKLNQVTQLTQWPKIQQTTTNVLFLNRTQFISSALHILYMCPSHRVSLWNHWSPAVTLLIYSGCSECVQRDPWPLWGFIIGPVYFYYFISDASEVPDNMLGPETVFNLFQLPFSYFQHTWNLFPWTELFAETQTQVYTWDLYLKLPHANPFLKDPLAGIYTQSLFYRLFCFSFFGSSNIFSKLYLSDKGNIPKCNI